MPEPRTVQQRGILAEIRRRGRITASDLVGAVKGWPHDPLPYPNVTRNSAQKALKRMMDRGLVEQDGQGGYVLPGQQDRSAGRWCDVCQIHGAHHTDRHPASRAVDRG